MKTERYKKDARGAALETLCRVERDNAYSSAVLNARINELPQNERALSTRLVYGTLQKRIYLDYILSAVSGRDVGKFDVPVRNALRLGAYQIKFCKRIPVSAAVNEAVDAVKLCGFTSAAGLTNAVLRKLINTEPELPENEVERLAVTHCVPAWLAYHLRKSYKDQNVADILLGLDTEPPVFLRVNNVKIGADELIKALAAEGVTAEKTDVENAIRAEKLASLGNCDAFKKGYFHVQDLSSQICAFALDVFENCRILDVCAAPGGKSFTAAENALGKCELIACDVHENRVRLIEDGASRLGLSCVKTKVADATAFNDDLGKFDRIICDVPCSGLGVIRRKPEIRYKGEEELKKYPDLQLKILTNAAKYLVNGGRLVYSTCTLNPKENEEVVERFLRENTSYSPAPLFDGACKKTFFPHTDGTDGFFMAAITKNGD